MKFLRKQYFVVKLMGIFFFLGLLVLPLALAIAFWVKEQYELYSFIQDILPVFISFWIVGFYHDIFENKNIDVYKTFFNNPNKFLLGEFFVLNGFYWIFMMISFQILRFSPVFEPSLYFAAVLTCQMVTIACITAFLMKMTKSPLWSIIGICFFVVAFLHMGVFVAQGVQFFILNANKVIQEAGVIFWSHVAFGGFILVCLYDIFRKQN